MQTAPKVVAAASQLRRRRAGGVALASNGSRKPAVKHSTTEPMGQAGAPSAEYNSSSIGRSAANAMSPGNRAANSAAPREGARSFTAAMMLGRQPSAAAAAASNHT